ncbi:Protein ROD1 [Candida viswanathii]|uniref:Protein ROD1 n=1 Tax=Candida viswanathii TaxID=5486 RepID=A0A367YLS8_9ASCO|nr:Protein ROD1 [Candida viswanathii]
MGKKLQHSTSRSTPLFDIRLKNLEHDVLVLKGNENDAASVLLAGNIVLSVNEPISIKKITLRLYSTLRIKADITSTNPRVNGRTINFTKKLYEHVWDPLEFNKYLSNMYSNSIASNNVSSPPALSRSHSSSSLFGGFRSKSSMSLSNHAGSSANLSALSTPGNATNNNSSAKATPNGYVLVQGNYEIPFSSILPGNLPESIEGLPGCSNIYRLEATVDRGKFHSSLVAKKHVRVVRTLTTDAVELSETIAVDNTWPKKVEYSLSCPSRALAIGSGTPISFMLVPLLKGLQLGDIKIELVENYTYVGNLPPYQNAERVIVEKKIPKPDPDTLFDKWEIDTFLKIPASLSKCTQDVDLLNHVKVRHKLKFNIGLINPDGHVSELRATLPIQLFISPFVTVSSRHDDELSDHGAEDILFTSDSFDHLSSLDNQNQGVNSNSSSHTSLTGLVAPPLYEKHIYDRLWSDVSPVETPMTSGATTPRSRPGERIGTDYGQFSMSPLDSQALTENLRQLSIQRAAQEAEEISHNSSVTASRIASPGGRATFNLEDDDSGSGSGQTQTSTSFNNNLRNNVTGDVVAPTARRPGLPRSNYSFLQDRLMTPPVHLSRVNSDTNIRSPVEMAQVPTYNEAMKGENIGDDLSPAYEPPLPGSHINLAELNRNLQNLDRTRKPTLSRGSSSVKLSSRGSSLNSSPSSSRNASTTNLFGLATSPNHHVQSVGKMSSSAADRSSVVPMRTSSSLSLHNLHFMNKKKDKK